jgi:hypothetical protein
MTIAFDPMLGWPQARSAVPRLASGVNRNAIRIGGLLAILGVLNALDLAYTLFAYHIGMLDEMNPIAAAYLSAGLKPSFIAYKLLMYLAGSVMLWRVRKSSWAVPACWALVAVYVGLGVLWSQWAREVERIYEVRIALSF